MLSSYSLTGCHLSPGRLEATEVRRMCSRRFRLCADLTPPLPQSQENHLSNLPSSGLQHHLSIRKRSVQAGGRPHLLPAFPVYPVGSIVSASCRGSICSPFHSAQHLRPRDLPGDSSWCWRRVAFRAVYPDRQATEVSRNGEMTFT